MSTITSNSIWVFLGERDGHEGVMAMANGPTIMPMVCLHGEALPLMRGHARELAKQAKITIKLAKFTAREEVEEFRGLE